MRIAEYPDNSGFATANEPSNDIPEPVLERVASRCKLPATLVREAAKLLRFGIGKPLLARMIADAQAHGTTVEGELLGSGSIREDTYFETLAVELGLPFHADSSGYQVHDIAGIDSQLIEPTMMRISHSSRPPVTAIVPRMDRLETLTGMLARLPALRKSLAVTTPSAIRKAVWEAGGRRRVTETTQALFDNAPEYSARIVFQGRQGFYTGIALCSSAAAAIIAPVLALLVLHIALTAIYLANLTIRLSALRRPRRQHMTMTLPPWEAGLPVYSVFVALYRESAVVGQLVTALNALDWPRSRLDIKLICEEDDTETLQALRDLCLSGHYEIVTVPVRHPRTKPKALAYALAGARGDYLAIYDAEDRPDPGQLREAYARFLACPDQIACLQAPLVITNAEASWLSALFAIEYSGLFRGLVPLLAARDLPVPLGGTSNHFRTRVLQATGGWDPYNMTEDADLGMRLHRLGYRTDVIHAPTFEDAPTHVRAWLGQRTRWFKGWMQTWLVLMREPRKLLRETGPMSFIVLHILIGGMLLSSLAHPVILLVVVYVAYGMLQASTQTTGLFPLILFALDTVNLFGSYAVFIALGRNRMSSAEQRSVGLRWVLVPAYWMLMSAAAWRAVVELRTNPFYWNKTAHRPVDVEKAIQKNSRSEARKHIEATPPNRKYFLTGRARVKASPHKTGIKNL